MNSGIPDSPSTNPNTHCAQTPFKALTSIGLPGIVLAQASAMTYKKLRTFVSGFLLAASAHAGMSPTVGHSSVQADPNQVGMAWVIEGDQLRVATPADFAPQVAEVPYCLQYSTHQICYERNLCELVCDAGATQVPNPIGGVVVGAGCHQVCKLIPECRTEQYCVRFSTEAS